MGVPVYGASWDSESDLLMPAMQDHVAIWRMAIMVLFVLMFILTTVLNTLFLVFFIRKPSLRNISNRFICSLTICNLVTAWLLLPVVVVDILHFNKWTDGHVFIDSNPTPFLCVSFGAIADFTTAASVFSTTLIALDRYFAITDPLHYQMMVTKTRSWLLMAFGWVMAMIVGSSSVLVESSPNTWNVCHTPLVPYTTNWRTLLSSIGNMFLCFVFPFAILLWAYLHIYKAAQQNSERARRSSVCSPSSDFMEAPRPNRNVSRTPSTRSTSSQIVSNIRRRLSNASLFLYKEEARAAKISVGVVILFILCWLPFYLLKIVTAVLPNVQIPSYVYKVGVLLTYLNTMVSPYLYIYRSKRIKREVWKLLGFKVKSEFEKKHLTYQHLSSNLEVPSLRYSDKLAYITPSQSGVERKQSILASYISQHILGEESNQPCLAGSHSTSSSICSAPSVPLELEEEKACQEALIV